MRTLLRMSVRTLAAVGIGLALAAAPPVTGQADAQEAGLSRQEARVIRVKILGMSCPFCAYGAKQKLKTLDGVEKLAIELESGLATLTMKPRADVSNEELRKTVDSAGFQAAAIVRNFESEYEDWRPKKMPGTGEGPSGG